METQKFIKEAAFGDTAKLPAMDLVKLIRRAEEAEAKNKQLEEALELASSMVNSYVVGPLNHNGNPVGVTWISYEEFMLLPKQPTDVTIASFDLANLLRDTENYKKLAAKRFNEIKALDCKISNLIIQLAPSFDELVSGNVVNVEGVLSYLDHAKKHDTVSGGFSSHA